MPVLVFFFEHFFEELYECCWGYFDSCFEYGVCEFFAGLFLVVGGCEVDEFGDGVLAEVSFVECEDGVFVVFCYFFFGEVYVYSFFGEGSVVVGEFVVFEFPFDDVVDDVGVFFHGVDGEVSFNFFFGGVDFSEVCFYFLS